MKKTRFRILFKEGKYYPQYKTFLFWKYFYESFEGYFAYEICYQNENRAANHIARYIERQKVKNQPKEIIPYGAE